jgi:hypothetical protein
VLGVVALVGLPAAQALPEPHMRLNFAMIGLAEGQTARLNAVNVRALAPPDGDTAPPDADRVCGVELAFLDADGSVLVGRDGSQFRVTVRLAAGHSAFLDLDARALLDPGDQPAPGALVDPGDRPARVPIRALVRTTRACLGSIDNPDIMPSLELFDTATGRTSSFVEPGSTRFIKEVDPGPSR